MDSLGAMFNQATLLSAMEDGSVVSDKVARVVDAVRDYDYRLDVKWIPRNRRAADEPAFAITERSPDGRENVVFFVDNEEGMTLQVLDRLHRMDAAKHDVLGEMDASNNAIKAAQATRQQDELAEAHEITKAVIRSPKSTYTANGVKYRD